MKTLQSISVALALALPLFGVAQDSAASNSKQQQTQNSDGDLFRRDVEVFSARGEFLFWRVQEGGLDYALAMDGRGWAATQCFAEGSFKTATFSGEPGFRVGMNFFRALKYWEMLVQYTRLTARGSASASKPSPANDFLTGTWPQIFTNPMALARSYIHLNYNMADVLVSRVFFPNPHLRLRLTGGGKAAWMNQFWKINYADAVNIETKIGNRWSFIGGGLALGTVFDWYWFWNFYLTGGFSFAGLIGTYENSSYQTTTFTPADLIDASRPLRNARYEDVRPAFTGQFYLGPCYQKSFPNQRFELFIGYELNGWWNLQEIYRSTNGTPSAAKETWINSSMLALQGLTTRASLDF